MTTLSYTADAVATGDGRNGHVRSSDALVDLDLGIPEDLGGAGGHVSNPEQLFAAGYSACFLSALNSVARAQHVKLRDAQVQAKVSTGRYERVATASRNRPARTPEDLVAGVRKALAAEIC